MKIKLLAASRLVVATTQEEAGRLLTALIPIMGHDFKKKRKVVKSVIPGEDPVTYEEVFWKNKAFSAGIELQKDESLLFWLTSRLVDIDAGEHMGMNSAARIADDIRSEAKQALRRYGNEVDPDLKQVLTKFMTIRTK